MMVSTPEERCRLKQDFVTELRVIRGDMCTMVLIWLRKLV